MLRIRIVRCRIENLAVERFRLDQMASAMNLHSERQRIGKTQLRYRLPFLLGFVLHFRMRHVKFPVGWVKRSATHHSTWDTYRLQRTGEMSNAANRRLDVHIRV